MLPLAFTVPSVSTMRCADDGRYTGHTGARSNLNLLGSPDRTKDSQYAISSEANASSEGVMFEKVVEPLNLADVSVHT